MLLTILREGTQHGGAGGVQLAHVRVCVCMWCVCLHVHAHRFKNKKLFVEKR